MKNNYNLIEIEIEDWQKKLDKVLKDENISFDTQQGFLDVMIDLNMGASDMAHVLISAKQRGFINDNKIWPGHKILLQTGGVARIDGMIALRRAEKKLKNGRTIHCREIIADTKEIPTYELEECQLVEQDIVFAKYDSELGRERAIKYLENVVPGYIYGRLKVIADHEDLRKHADILIDKINEMVGKLT